MPPLKERTVKPAPGRAVRPPVEPPVVERPSPAGAKPKVSVGLKPEGGWRNLGGAAHEKGLVLALEQVAPGKGGRVNLEVAAIAGARPGDIHRVDIAQRTGSQVTGGGTYVLVVEGLASGRSRRPLRAAVRPPVL